MNIQLPAITAATRFAPAPRNLNIDVGTYRASEREQGRGYGRSIGYAGPRPYTSQASAKPLFRVC